MLKLIQFFINAWCISGVLHAYEHNFYFPYTATTIMVIVIIINYFIGYYQGKQNG